jgi:phospholipid-translocating ATPase
MADGVYQSVITFFIPYLVVASTPTIAGNGKDVTERLRLGAYIAHPAVITINLYILINTYTWDWLTVLIITISDLLIFFWTGVYTSSTFAMTFYGAAQQIYSELSFWIVLFLVPLLCIAPRYAGKACQKVFWPHDVDIIREQITTGKFSKTNQDVNEDRQGDLKESLSSSSGSTRRKHNHQPQESVDEDLRPIYPPSFAATSIAGHGPRSQRGSDGTNYTGHDLSMEEPVNQPVDVPDAPVRPSIDRVRPSYDRMRASMDRSRVRASFEASNEFTSAAMLSRFESTRSGSSEPEGNGLVSRIRRRTRGKSFKTPFAFHRDQSNNIREQE